MTIRASDQRTEPTDPSRPSSVGVPPTSSARSCDAWREADVEACPPPEVAGQGEEERPQTAERGARDGADQPARDRAHPRCAPPTPGPWSPSPLDRPRPGQAGSMASCQAGGGILDRTRWAGGGDGAAWPGSHETSSGCTARTRWSPSCGGSRTRSRAEARSGSRSPDSASGSRCELSSPSSTSAATTRKRSSSS